MSPGAPGESEQPKSIGYWSAVAIGVGGMVGGGIFAVLGLATELARGGTPLAFALAGGVALITCYSYVRLSVTYPSQGGTVEFLNQAFGTGTFTGGLNVLLWMSYVVMLALYAYAFGGYGASLLPAQSMPLAEHLLASAVIILFTILNALGAKAAGSLETVIVGLKTAILLLFVGVGARAVHFDRLAPNTWTGPVNLVAGGMVIFLAYEGFELIANTAGDVRAPRRTLPRAYFSAVGFVVLLYVAISTVTVGSLDLDKIAAAQDYALAAAARPFMGQTGFVMIAAAALLSTGSAINATLYGAGRLSYVIAKEGQLPEMLERKVWRRPMEGLLITSLLTLVVANALDLSKIAVMGSAGFLLIFAAVNAAALRLNRQARCNRVVAGSGVVACVAALAALVWQRAHVDATEVAVLPAMVAVAFAVEGTYRRVSGKERRVHLSGPAPDAD